MLIVSRKKATPERPEGQNRFECRTCPYEYLIEHEYYERTYFKRKKVDDVIGGKEAWENVDKTDGESWIQLFLWFWQGQNEGSEGGFGRERDFGTLPVWTKPSFDL